MKYSNNNNNNSVVLRKPAAWDVTVPDTFADSHLEATSAQSGSAANRPHHHPYLHTDSHWDSWFLEPTSHWCHWRHWQTHLSDNWGTTWNHLPIPAHFSCDTTR